MGIDLRKRSRERSQTEKKTKDKMKALDHPRSTCTSIIIVDTNRNLIKRPTRIPHTPHLTVIPEMKTIPRV